MENSITTPPSNLKYHHKIAAIICFFLYFSVSSISNPNNQEDTVIIKDEPVVINQEVDIQKYHYKTINIALTGEIYFSSVSTFPRKHPSYKKFNNNDPLIQGFSCGMLHYIHLNQFMFGLGGSLEQFTQKLCYCEKSYVQDTIIKYVNGEMTKETKEILSEGYTNVTLENTYAYISIPVKTGYMVNVNRFGFFIRIGLDISFLLENTFQYINPETEKRYTIKSETFINPNYTLHGEIGASYQLNHHIGFLITPWYAHSLNYSFRHNSSDMLINKGGIRFSVTYSY